MCLCAKLDEGEEVKLEQYKAYFQDNFTTLYNHDCRSMYELPDNSIQCVVTSPPYWGLRKYAGNQDLIWGDNSSSWKGALGLEPTPELYVQHIVEICREIKRVLRPDGVFWLNIGDSYASGKGTCYNPGGGSSSLEGHSNLKDALAYPLDRGNKSTLEASGLKPKDLCLIPERFALAAQADGWWVRSRICWNKPNPMPESVTDRPTDSWEHIWMLTKSANYYWDMAAVREVADYDGRKDTIMKGSIKYADGFGQTDNPNTLAVVGHERWPNQIDGLPGRNLRSAWTFPTQPFKGAHFATFPEALPERCIKAATSERGCCPKCGKPWERVIEHKNMEIRRTDWGDDAGNRTASSGTMISPPRTKTLDWQPGCECGLEPIPCTVLDPFAGSGTTLWVAKKLGRRSVGYELSTEYCELAMNRNRQEGLL